MKFALGMFELFQHFFIGTCQSIQRITAVVCSPRMSESFANTPKSHELYSRPESAIEYSDRVLSLCGAGEVLGGLSPMGVVPVDVVFLCRSSRPFLYTVR